MKKLFKSLRKIKEKKDTLLKKPSLFLIKKLHIKSWQITSLGFLIGLISIFFLGTNNLIFVILIITSIIFDIFDGTVARMENKTGKTFSSGVLLDDLSDRTVFVLIIFKIYYLTINPLFLLTAIAYILIKGSHIYIKQKVSTNIQILYMDRLLIILPVFGFYEYFALLILSVLLLNALQLFKAPR